MKRVALAFLLSSFGAAAAFVCLKNAQANAPVGQYTFNDGGVNDGGTVRDVKTGLLWERGASMPRRSFTDATTYCQGLAIGAVASGWRLPLIKELLTLIDTSGTVLPLWDQPAFGVSAPAQIWSQTPDVSGANGQMWAIDVTVPAATSFVPTTLLGTVCVHE